MSSKHGNPQEAYEPLGSRLRQTTRHIPGSCQEIPSQVSWCQYAAMASHLTCGRWLNSTSV
ncbi:hypothetical protein CBOM_05881 [Ceraceosorus bombacis]|uniref:Uncharacterized protein n=1 Tax=Ceraceosorus bombacis TaxID=401625 RepID=A0A0P1B8R3_9BASI|nr:hypothetical protein CBOM_05881 [Ceraceosorus bombacis]